MTIDLSKLKVGDTVISRIGISEEVLNITYHPESYYPLILSFVDASRSYTQNGRFFLSLDASSFDIVEIIPKELKEVKEETKEETKEGFKKFDGGKPDLSLIDPITAQLYCEASKVGEAKYGRGNYSQFTLDDVPRFYAALQRHLTGYELNGEFHGFLYEERDPVDGQRHLGSAIWCITRLQEAVYRYGYDAVRKKIRGF
jgi:hypothetical protein